MEMAKVLSIQRTRFIVEVLRDERWCPTLVQPHHETLGEAQAYVSTRDPGLTYQIVKETVTREVVA
jgi:hypothetical protein